MEKVVFKNAYVAETFTNYPEDLRAKLLFLRRLILETAAETSGVGKLEETLRWGQPSYIPEESKSGTTVRIGHEKFDESVYGVYVHCQTSVISSCKKLYPKLFTYGGNRSILFDANDEIPVDELKHCIALALTYHLDKK